MRIFVVGATGRTGVEVVKQALEQGHTVTAYVRSPEKLKTQHPNLKVQKGDIFKKEELAAALAGHEAAISCLGFPRKQPVRGYLESHRCLVEAMRICNVTRLITMTSWYTDTVDTKAGFMIRWVVVPVLKPVLEGMHEMEKYLYESCQDISYTVVRPPALLNGSKSGKVVHTSEDHEVATGTSFNKITRSDVAVFMLSCLNNSNYDRKMVAVSTVPIKK